MAYFCNSFVVRNIWNAEANAWYLTNRSHWVQRKLLTMPVNSVKLFYSHNSTTAIRLRAKGLQSQVLNQSGLSSLGLRYLCGNELKRVKYKIAYQILELKRIPIPRSLTMKFNLFSLLSWFLMQDLCKFNFHWTILVSLLSDEILEMQDSSAPSFKITHSVSLIYLFNCLEESTLWILFNTWIFAFFMNNFKNSIWLLYHLKIFIYFNILYIVVFLSLHKPIFKTFNHINSCDHFLLYYIAAVFLQFFWTLCKIIKWIFFKTFLWYLLNSCTMYNASDIISLNIINSVKIKFIIKLNNKKIFFNNINIFFNKFSLFKVRTIHFLSTLLM